MPHLVVFSHLRWSFVYQRPQQVLTRLSRHYPVVFIEEPRRGHTAAHMERIAEQPGIEIVCPRTQVDAPGFHDDQLSVLKPLVADYLRHQGIDDYILWFYTPMALPLIAPLHPRAVVYDCMDELSAFKNAPKQLRQRENALLKLADVVFAGGPALYALKSQLHPNVHCLPSAVDVDHFSPTALRSDSDEALRAAQDHQGIGRPRLGYFGVIDERLDIALLAALADADPRWQIVMVGPVVKIDPQTLPQRPNIHWLGLRSYAELPHLLAQWDVCLLPFALNEATRFISPTKTLEYLAGGKPVVSTAIADVAALYGQLVRVAGDTAAFIDACAAALAQGGVAAEALAPLQATLTSWDQTAEVMHRCIEQELQAARSESAQHAGPMWTAAAKLPPALPTPDHPLAPHTPWPASQLAPPRQVRNLIIGAGPTGLATAYYLAQHTNAHETLLIEREDRVGGLCRSIHERGYTFDHAGHIMFSNDAQVLALYQTLLGDNLHWQNREAWIYSKQVYTRYPFQGSLYGLPPEVLKECLVGAIEARFGPLRGPQTNTPRAAAAEPANFEQFIHQVWGAGIARHFALPYNRKLWAVPLAEMETSWLGGRVPLPDLEQMIEGALQATPAPMGPNARFGYPLHGGFQALMDAFLPHLSCELALGTSVLQLSPAQRSVRLDDGRAVRYQTLISTMPLPQLVQACGDQAPAPVRQAALALRHVSVRCVNLGIQRPALSDKHWIYYPEDTVFHRIFLQGNASPYCSPPDGFGLTCEISYGPDKPLPCADADLIERVIQDCRRVQIIRADDVIEVANQVDMPCAYVVYDHARAANVQTIQQWLSEFGIISAGRYGQWEYYNSDHAFIAGRLAATQALERAASDASTQPTLPSPAPLHRAAPVARRGTRSV